MKRLLAIMLAVAMLFGLIPSNVVVFAQDEVESTELLLDTVLGNRDISKETWTVQLSDGTVIPNAKVSSNKNGFMPMVEYIAEFTQADLDQLAAPGKRISILGKGHSIEVKKGKGQVFSKLVNGVPTVKDGVHFVSFTHPWNNTASVEEGVIVINAESVDKNVAWKLETVDGKSLAGTVTLEGDHYVVKLNRASVKEAVVEGKTFLGIDVNKGGVYSSDTQKICDYTYLKADNDTLEYQFEAQLVSSVSEGKILFDLIATDTKTTPTWTIKTNHGLILPVTRQDFLNFIESPNDTYSARNPFQNWVFGVYIDKDELAKELKKHGYELIGFGSDQTRNTVVKMFGTEYSLDGAVKEFEETATIKQNIKYFFDIDVDPDTGEYYCKIRLSESDRLIDLQSVELYLDIEMKASNRVLVDPNGGKVRIEDPVTSDVVMHEKEFELVFGANEELKDLPNAFKKGESFLGWFDKNKGEKVQFPIEVNGEHQIEARFKALPGKDQNYGFTVFAKFEEKDDLHPLKGYTIERNLEHENGYTTAAFAISIKTPELKKQVEDLGYLFSEDIKSEIDVLDYLNYIDYDDGVLFDSDEVTEDLPITVSDETTDVQYSFVYREAAGQVEGGKIIFVLKDNPIEKYKVSFNPNGGTLDGSTAVKEVEVVKGKTVDQPSDPVNDGYIFLHWAIDSETGEKFNFSKPINADIKLVAKYELDGVKVTLDMGDGSLYVDNKFVKGSHTLIFPENAQFEPTNYQFYLKGKTIDYWVDEAGNKVTFPVALTKNVTFRAVYRDVTDTNNQLFKHFTRLENQNDTDKVEVVGTTQRTSRTVTSDSTRTEEQYTTEIDNLELAKALGLPAVEVVDIIVFLDGYDKFSDEPKGLIAEKVTADFNQANGKSKVVYKTLMSSEEGQVEGGKVVVVVKEKKLYTLTINPNGGKIQPQFISYKVEAGKTFSGFNGILKPTLRGKQFERWVLPDGTTFNIDTYVFNSDVTLTAEYKDLPINNGAGFVVQATIGDDTIPLQDVVVTSRVVFYEGNLEKAIIYTKIDEESLAKALGDKYELVRINSIDVVAKGHFANKGSWPLNQGYMENDLETFQKRLVEVIAFNHGRWVDALTVKVQLMKDIGQVEGGTITLNLEAKNKYKVSFINFGGKTPNGQQEFTVVHGGTIKDEVFKPTKEGYTFVKWVVDGADYDPKNDPVTKHITPVAVYEKLPEHNGYGFQVLVRFVDAKGEMQTKAMNGHLVSARTSTVGDMTSQRYSVRTNHKAIEKALEPEYNLLKVKSIGYTINGYKFNKDSSQSAANPLSSDIKDIYLEEKNVAATVVTEHHKDFGQVEGGTFVIQVEVEAAKPKHVIWFKVDDDVIFEDVRKRTVEEGKKLAEPTYIPLKKGYRFLGWYKENATGAYDFEAEVNEAFNLFAKFEKIENPGILAVKVKYNDGTKDVIVDLPGVLVSPEVKDKGRNAEYVYELELPHTEIGSVIDPEFALEKVSDKEFVIYGVKNAKSKGTRTVLDVHDIPRALNSDGKAGVKLSVEINKQYGQVEGGVITFVVKVQRKHTVTLDARGGRFKGESTYKIASGSTFEKPRFDPYKKGYTFLGWYNGTELYDFVKPVTQDLNLVAHYASIEEQKNLGFKVVLVLPSGDALPMDASVVTRMGQKPDAINMTHIYSVVSTMDEIKKVLDEKGLELLEILQYEVKANSQHYREPQTIREEVDSWNIKKIQMSSDKLSYTFSVTLPESHDVLGGEVRIKVDATEVGKQKHTVTFNPNGGKYAGPTEVVVLDGRKLEKPLFTPKKSGFKFIGWFKNDYLYNFQQPVRETFELLAKFEEIPVNPDIKHFVTFDANDGEYSGPSVVEIQDGEKVGIPNSPVKKGHKFLYWALWTEDGGKFNFSAPIRENITLVAVYEVDNSGGNSGGGGSNPDPIDPGFVFPNIGTETVEIEEEETPLSKVLSDDVLINGQKTAISIGKDGTIVVTAEDLKEVKEPVLMSVKMANADNYFVAYQKKDEKSEMMPISLYFDGRMYVVIDGPGTYIAKRNRVWLHGMDENHWARPFAELVSARKIMVGNEDGEFMPNMPTTRAMLTQILARLQFASLEAIKSNHYDDVSAEKWYANAVNWATEKGIVSGVGDGKFAPEDAITREQLAVMIRNYLKLSNWKFEMKVGAPQFNDHDTISDWAKDAVTELKDYGIFEGKPGYMFDPKAEVTRAEVATVIAKLIEMYFKSLMIRY